eukprot:scaffold30066_cov15-Tisochrysis_lutea.AAC.1
MQIISLNGGSRNMQSRGKRIHKLAGVGKQQLKYSSSSSSSSSGAIRQSEGHGRWRVNMCAKSVGSNKPRWGEERDKNEFMGGSILRRVAGTISFSGTPVHHA